MVCFEHQRCVQVDEPELTIVTPDGFFGSWTPDYRAGEGVVSGLSRIEIERGGLSAGDIDGLSDDDVMKIIADSIDDADLTVMLTNSHREGRLMIGLDKGKVFIAKEYLDELFQFVLDNSLKHGTAEMNLGGSAVELELRYLADLTALTAVTRNWLAGHDDADSGVWERR